MKLKHKIIIIALCSAALLLAVTDGIFLLGFLRLLTISRVEENYGFVKKQFNLFMLSFVGLLLLLLGIDYFLVDRFFLKRIEKTVAFTKGSRLKAGYQPGDRDGWQR